MIPLAVIDQVAANLADHPEAAIATLAEPLADAQALFNPNVVKVLSDINGLALTFSRAPLPWARDSFAVDRSQLPPGVPYRRHIGIYAYCAGFLADFVSWGPCWLEDTECSSSCVRSGMGGASMWPMPSKLLPPGSTRLRTWIGFAVCWVADMKVLFVCMGNICRPPTAEGVFRQRIEQAGLGARVEIDSAGTGDWHVGKAPDQRACEAARRRGYTLDALRARQVSIADFQRFDLILAMDHDNLARLQALRPKHGAKAEFDLLLRRYGLGCDVVPDPYYGEADGFDNVLNLIEEASDALLAEIKGRL